VFSIESLYHKDNTISHINKEQNTSFEFSSILLTVDRLKHLIMAWIIQKFIQLVNFVTFNVLFFWQSSMVKPVWVGTFGKRAIHLITGSFYLQKCSCENLFYVGYFCGKISSTCIRKFKEWLNWHSALQVTADVQKQGGTPIWKGQGRSLSRVQIKDSGLT